MAARFASRPFVFQKPPLDGAEVAFAFPLEFILHWSGWEKVPAAVWEISLGAGANELLRLKNILQSDL